MCTSCTFLQEPRLFNVLPYHLKTNYSIWSMGQQYGQYRIRSMNTTVTLSSACWLRAVHLAWSLKSTRSLWGSCANWICHEKWWLGDYQCRCSQTLSAAHLHAHEYKHEFHIMSLLQQKNLIHFTVARKITKCDDYKNTLNLGNFREGNEKADLANNQSWVRHCARKRNAEPCPSILTSGHSFWLENSQRGRRLPIDHSGSGS